MTRQELFELLRKERLARLNDEFDDNLEPNAVERIVNEIKEVEGFWNIDQLIRYLRDEGLTESSIIELILHVIPEK